MRRFSRHVAAACLALLATGCGERCLWYEYAPPPAYVTLRASDTGELLCEDKIAVTSRGEYPTLFAAEKPCEYAINLWFPTPEAGASITLSVDGYDDVVLEFPVQKNDCDEIQAPPKQELTLTPVGPEPEPDGGTPPPPPRRDAGPPGDAGDGGNVGDASAPGTDASSPGTDASLDASPTDASAAG